MHSTRRDVLYTASSIAFISMGWSILPIQVSADSITGPADGILPDLPPNAVRSYLQYRTPLQMSADYYIFELQEKIKNPDEWGAIADYLFQTNNVAGQVQLNRMEREFINPMRILSISMPPDVADRMQETQDKFERAMQTVYKATAGVRRDLKMELDKNAAKDALAGWEEGRVALNEFFVALNEATGLSEMKTIPPAGPHQTLEYGRSAKKYFDLLKKSKLCQNRGGGLQVVLSGYSQDSCGIPDQNDYFYQ